MAERDAWIWGWMDGWLAQYYSANTELVVHLTPAKRVAAAPVDATLGYVLPGKALRCALDAFFLWDRTATIITIIVPLACCLNRWPNCALATIIIMVGINMSNIARSLDSTVGRWVDHGGTIIHASIPTTPIHPWPLYSRPSGTCSSVSSR